MQFLKNIATNFPETWRQELKRIYYRYQIKNDTFRTEEPEFVILDQFISEGDWVIDIGANIGHYTRKFSDLVGPEGRVIALEPVPNTFMLLSANAALFKSSNVTLLNMAASDHTGCVGIEIPNYDGGAINYYQASIVNEGSKLSVMSIALDSLRIKHPVSLVKIDAEGHDPIVLLGMSELLERDHPILIIETSSPEVFEKLLKMGYSSEKLKDSPNTLFKWLP